jgi:hypothetical protein
MRVAKWGNSLAVRLPDAIVKALKLKAGDEIEILASGTRRFERSPSSRDFMFLPTMGRGAFGQRGPMGRAVSATTS